MKTFANKETVLINSVSTCTVIHHPTSFQPTRNLPLRQFFRVNFSSAKVITSDVTSLRYVTYAIIKHYINNKKSKKLKPNYNTIKNIKHIKNIQYINLTVLRRVYVINQVT